MTTAQDVFMKFKELSLQVEPTEFIQQRKYTPDLVKGLAGYANIDVCTEILRTFDKELLNRCNFIDDGKFKYANRVIFNYPDCYFSAKSLNKDKNPLFPPRDVAGKKPLFYIPGNGEQCVICEGETDAIALRHIDANIDIAALGGVQSINSLKDLGIFYRGKKVGICFDNDSAGLDGIEKCAKLLISLDYHVSIIKFSAEYKDIDELWRAQGENSVDLIEEVEWQPKESKKTQAKSTFKDGVHEGQRNTSCFEMVVKYRAKKMSKEEVLTLLREWNTRNDPPLPDAEVLGCVASAYKIDAPQDTTDILELLNKEETQKAYLDLGYNDVNWWYGFNLVGKEAILLDDQRVLRNTLEKFKDKNIGENQIKGIFDYEGYIGDIAPTILKETVKKYHTKEQRNHLVNPKEVYKTIRDKFLWYMDFEGKDEIADVLTCWVIATYCYPLFYWFAHVLINAPSGSGKSKCLFLIMQMAFRGYDIGAAGGATPAQIFRTIEGNRGTLTIDEFEQTEGGKGQANDTQRLVNQIFNASATKDAYVIRTEQIEKKWRSWKFPIFCPKAAANISGINPTSLSRYIGFKWLKTNNKVKGSRKPYKEKNKIEFVPIREDCYLLILENWKQIKNIYDNLEIDNITNRVEDNWLPLFAIAQFIDRSEGEPVNAEAQLQKYVKDYEGVEIETGDITAELFQILYDGVKGDSCPRDYQPKLLADWDGVKTLLEGYKSPANFIGRKLKLYKFPTKRSGGVRTYLLTGQNLKKIIDTYFSTN